MIPAHEAETDRSGDAAAEPAAVDLALADLTLVQDASERQAAGERSRRPSGPPADVPGYEILRCLGQGAYGSVWLASERNTGKQVAIKFYTHRQGLDWSLLSREVEKLATLYTSRHIVRLIAVGWNADPPHYVMEYLENGSLDGLLADGPIPAAEAVRIARGVLQALVHAHGSGILHCDLKPANVLLDADFEPRICDFGQSRLSYEQSPALGTLFYMAPEQADLKAVPDARWDVYALGSLLYRMLVGEPPHRTDASAARIERAGNLQDRLAAYRAVLRESPRPEAHRRVAGVDRRLAEVIDCCLHPDPSQRFRNAQAVLDALEVRERQRARRPVLLVGIAAPVVLLLAAVPIIGRAMNHAVDTARTNLTERALESDRLTARILARSLEREFDDRRAELVRIAEDPRLREAILASEGRPWGEREELFAQIAEYKRRVDDDRDESIRPPDASWFVTDASGLQLWRHPYDARTVDHSFAWRDYFHGRGIEYPPDEIPDDIEPIRDPHVSLAFRSEATLRYMVAISVPIRDEQGERVIGVLARTTHLGQLLEDYRRRIEGADAERVDRVVALVDQRRWELLDHPWLKGPGGDVAETLVLSPDVRRALEWNGETVHVEPRYEDPVARHSAEYAGPWLAAFAPVGHTGWTAIVQERRPEALRAIDQMRESLLRYSFWAASVCCGLVGLLWFGVVGYFGRRDERRGASSLGRGAAGT